MGRSIGKQIGLLANGVNFSAVSALATNFPFGRAPSAMITRPDWTTD